MEHSYLTLLLLFVFFITLSLFIIFYNCNSNLSHTNVLPGSFGFPFIGESFEFLSYGWKGHPEKFIFNRMTKYSSHAFKTSLLGEPTAVLCGPAGKKFLFSNENKLVTSWWPDSVNNNVPFTSNSSSKYEANKMRKPLPHFLKPEALQRYIGIMDQIAQRHLVAYWEHKDEVIVYSLAEKFTFLLACRLFLSIEGPSRVTRFSDSFHLLASGVLSIPIDFPGTPINRAIKASSFIRKELLRIIEQRKIDLDAGEASPTQDILSHMLLTSDENGNFMTDLDIADKILAFLIGGHDTGGAVCTFVVKYLAELPHSHIYDEVYKQQMEIEKSKPTSELLNWDDTSKMKYSWNVACEVLRMVPPVPGAFREAIHNFSFNGFTISKGSKIYWSANASHKNPESFPEPEKFDPSRFKGKGPAPYTFVPFGGGPRMCPGKEYANLKVLVLYKWKKILPNGKIICDPIPRPQRGLPVRLYPHEA